MGRPADAKPAAEDCVLIVSDRAGMDYRMVVDTRNALKECGGGRNHIVKL